MLNGFGSKQVPHVLVHHKGRSLSVEMGSGDTALGSQAFSDLTWLADWTGLRLRSAVTLDSDWNCILA